MLYSHFPENLISRFVSSTCMRSSPHSTWLLLDPFLQINQSHNISNAWLLNQKLESRQHFCLIDVEYSIFYSDTKWNYHGGILMQKKLLNIQVLPKQQSILKIKKVWLLAWNKCTKWLSFQTTCLWVVFVSGLPCGTERDWSVHFHVLHSCYFADQHTLRFLTCTFSLSIMKQKQKLSSFIYAI